MLDLGEEWDACERCGELTPILAVCSVCGRLLCESCLPIEKEFCDECLALGMEEEEEDSS